MTEEEILAISSLSDLPEDKLDFLLSNSDHNKNVLLYHIIKYHYPKLEVPSTEYLSLVEAYKSSWILEKIYRNNGIIRKSYTPVYIDTGIIRELVHNMYFTNNNLKIH